MANEQFPAWDEPVSRGELMHVIVRLRRMTTKLAVAIVAASRNDREDVSARIDEYVKIDNELAEIIDKIGQGTFNAE